MPIEAIEAVLSGAIERAFRQVLTPPAAEAYARSGSFRLRLNFASPTLADEFLPSFLPEDKGNADLTLAFLTATDVDLSKVIPEPPNKFRHFAGANCFAFWQPGPPRTLFTFDRRAGRALIWLADGVAAPWLYGKPAVPIMHALAVPTPWIGVHAAAVGRGGRMLLLAGKSRAGKTTASLACARAGWTFAGDDFVFANSLDGRIAPLNCTARLRTDVASAFPDLLAASRRTSDVSGDVRHELRLADVMPMDRFGGGTLAALLLPRRQGASHVQFAPARRFDAIAALVRISTEEQPGWVDTIREKIALLIELAPVFSVDTGPDPDAIPDAFAEFLDRL